MFRSVDPWRVEGGVEPVERDMQDPDAVKVDKEMRGRTSLVVGLEEHPGPGDLSEFHEAFGGRNIDQSLLLQNQHTCLLRGLV